MTMDFNSNIFDLQRQIKFAKFGREINPIQAVYYDGNGNIAYADMNKGLHIGKKTIGMRKSIEDAQLLCNEINNEAQK